MGYLSNPNYMKRTQATDRHGVYLSELLDVKEYNYYDEVRTRLDPTLQPLDLPDTKFSGRMRLSVIRFVLRRFPTANMFCSPYLIDIDGLPVNEEGKHIIDHSGIELTAPVDSIDPDTEKPYVLRTFQNAGVDDKTDYHEPNAENVLDAIIHLIAADMAGSFKTLEQQDVTDLNQRWAGRDMEDVEDKLQSKAAGFLDDVEVDEEGDNYDNISGRKFFGVARPC